MFSKVKPLAKPFPPCHVLILIPLSVPLKETPFTVTLVTPLAEGYLPRLPTLHNNNTNTLSVQCIEWPYALSNWNFIKLSHLIPWPGPQVTCSMERLEVPSKIPIQSSPAQPKLKLYLWINSSPPSNNFKICRWEIWSTCCYVDISKLDVGRRYVNSIDVRAVIWGLDSQSLRQHVVTWINVQMELLAVNGSNVSHDGIRSAQQS